MIMRGTLTVFFLFTAVFVHAQDLTGVWQGHFRSNNLNARSALFDDRYKFEVQIAQHDKSLEAVTYSYLSTIFYGKADANGSVNPHTGKALLQEGKLLEVRMQPGTVACTMTCFLQYSKSGDEEFLEGSFVSMNIRDSSNCGRGTILLRKVISSDFYKEPFLVKREKEKEDEKKEPLQSPSTAIAKATIPKKSPGLVSSPKKSPGTASANSNTKKNAPANPSTTGPLPKKTFDTASNKPVSHLAIASNKPLSHKPVTGTPGAAKKTGSPVPVVKGILRPPLVRVDPLRDSHSRMPIHTDTGIVKRINPLITPNVLLSRSNELVRSIIVNTNEVVLNIYDDGAIDHDTISVYLDKKQVISHAMLTDRPIVVTLHLDETNSYHELVMVAENEGDIPPNTSLMIVKAGDKQYEVRITSTGQKNAVVTFKFEPSKAK